MSIIYKKMNLFDAPEGSILVHAANAEGIWGSGIAAQMRERYPEQHEYYSDCCYLSDRIGTSICKYIDNMDKHRIVNLVTSSLDSKNPDTPEIILINTTLALEYFLKDYKFLKNPIKIYSNKFNSGIFNVPWERTELVLKTLTDRYNVEWTVCEYEGK